MKGGDFLIILLLAVLCMGIVRTSVEYERSRARKLYDFTVKACEVSPDPADCMFKLSLVYGARP